jgi:trimethylamine--corrinoid protein Co-methyltransferase
MATTTLPYASPEAKLLDAAIAKMGKFYQLPVFGTGGCSDSKVFDQQAGSESTLTILMAALSGANLIHDVGYLELGLTASYEMIVMTDEIIGMVKRILAGITISKETLAEDEIERAGPGGNYLASEHTLKYYKNELWFPRLFDRDTYEGWKKAVSKDMASKAKEKAKELLCLEHTSFLPQNIVEKVTSIAEKVN